MNEYKIAREEVARMVGIEVKELTYILYKERIDKLYVEFEIPKKNGKTRLIHSPKKNLKWIQRQLSKSLFKTHLEYLEKNDIQSIVSHGFQRGKSIITNAKIHKNKKYLLNVDISDFFSSFHFGRVRGYFEKSRAFKFSKEVSTIISQLVCYKGVLPQSAPTSPIITNIIFNIVDLRILALAKKYKLDYTRYADDMSFSTNNSKFIYEYKVFIDELTAVLKKSGFNINSDKTRLEYSSSRQEVTGLTVNNKVNASRLFIKDTRAMANQLYTKGEFLINGENGTLNQLEGRFSFINQMDWHNNKIEYIIKKSKSNKKYISGLNVREKQYSSFKSTF